jgi:predicted pyridoxine 5'-phosphate oxidase superfamily flavin-nucleotide-binding protein
MPTPLYHQGNRQLQDQFDSRRIADRLEQVTLHAVFSDNDRAFVARCAMFFLATCDASGQPDVSYKGGLPGFIRVVEDSTLAFPHYDGNGMFKSLGNILVNPRVALLFVDFEHPSRMRVNGTASVSAEDPLLASFPGAQLIVRVTAEHIFPNCPRYVHRMQLVEHSIYAPRPEYEPPEPDWKRMVEFRDALPRQDQAATAE